MRRPWRTWRRSRTARWWPWEQARRLPLAFDHSNLLAQARERLQHKTAYTALPVFVLPPPFTLSALQKAFEVLLDAPLEKKSFRRRMEEADCWRRRAMNPRRKAGAAPPPCSGRVTAPAITFSAACWVNSGRPTDAAQGLRSGCVCITSSSVRPVRL